METKEVKIHIPEGYEIDKENSTFECIKFKKIKNLEAYDDIAEYLFNNKNTYFLDDCGGVAAFIPDRDSALLVNNCVSEKQCKKLLALNKFINVTTYLNKYWKPDYNDSTYKKYSIEYNVKTDTLEIRSAYNTSYGTPCFKSQNLAKQAIEILGEETIKLALSQV